MKNKIRMITRKLLKKLGIIVIVLGLIFVVLKFLMSFFSMIPSNKQTKEEKRFEKNNTAIFGDQEVSEEDAVEFVKIIDDYMTYCNKKQYEQAYNLLDESTKEKFYPTIDEFKTYVDEYFSRLKRYSYQNMSNVDNDYVYQLNIFDDVVAYGADAMPTQEIVYVVLKKSDNGSKLGLNGYVETNKRNKEYTVGDIKITVNSEEVYYDHMLLNITLENNSDQYLVWSTTDIAYVIDGKKRVEYNVKHNFREFLFVTPDVPVTLNLYFEKSFDTEGYNYHYVTINNAYFIDYDLFMKMRMNQISFSDIEEYPYRKTYIQVQL